RLPQPVSMSYLEKFRASKANLILQKLARVLQFISAIVSLGLFSQRLKAILTRSHDYSKSDGAVEGILAAASLYSLLATLMQFALRHGAPKILRWFLILMDFLFIGAFIGVAVLTRPNGGPFGPAQGSLRPAARHQRTRAAKHSKPIPLPPAPGHFHPGHHQHDDDIAPILHAFTAIFHEIREKVAAHRDNENLHNEGPGAHGYMTKEEKKNMTKAEKKQAKRDGLAH
ncbi:hypothetical protein PG985_012892, partial [Apiospora marii]|uniref:uncharacterized protein n=1 Tax=Apiospora marii TaxID=335849 RepID=UPI003131897F